MRQPGADGDATTDRTGAQRIARGPLQHRDVLIGEGIALVGAEVAQPVHVDVVLRREAADAELVAGDAAIALAGRYGDAGNVAQRLIEGGDVLLFQHLAGDDVDGLRRVLHRAGQAADRGAALQGVGETHGLNVHRGQHQRIAQGRCVAVLRQGGAAVPAHAGTFQCECFSFAITKAPARQSARGTIRIPRRSRQRVSAASTGSKAVPRAVAVRHDGPARPPWGRDPEARRDGAASRRRGAGLDAAARAAPPALLDTP